MQSQAYPSQGGDYMKMSPGEQDAENVHQQDVEGGQQKKKSVVGKVKDKAKKFKSKIKGSGKKKTDEHGNEVDHSSSSSGEGEEEESPVGQHQPRVTNTARGFQGSEEARKDGVVHGGEVLGGEEHKSEGFAPKHDEGSTPKHDETGGLQDQLGKLRVSEDPAAPAAGAAWYDQPPSVDESHKRQEEVPSALGQESSGVSSGIASSGLGSEKKDKSSEFAGFDTEEKRDYTEDKRDSSPSSDEKVPEDISKPRDESLKPVTDGVDNSGRDLLSSEVTDSQPPKLDTTDEALSETPSGESETGNKELKPSGSQKGWMQRATEGVTSMKNALLGSPKSTAATSPVTSSESEEQAQNKTWTDKARDAAVSVKDTAGSTLPSSTAPSDVPVSEQASETGDAAADKSSGITSRAVETATGLKDTVASKLGYGTGGTGETGTGTETAVGSEVDPTKSGPGVAQKVKDTVASKLGYGGGNTTGTGTDVASTGKVDDQSGSKLFTPDEHDTALSQKITDLLTLGGGKNTSDTHVSDATAPHDSTQGKGVYDRVTGAVGSLLGKKSDEKPATGTADTSSGTNVVSEQ